MEIPEFFQKAVEAIGGKNLYGQPRYRVVWSKDRRWEAGVLKGRLKYIWPDGKAMECHVLEVWYPPQYFGDPKEWKEDISGPFPYEGMYAIKTPLVVQNGDELVNLPLTESTLDSIRQKHLADLEWNQSDALSRYRAIEAAQIEWQLRADEAADREADDLFEHYNAHKEALDNADNRVWTFPKHLDSTIKGGKMPIR